MIPYVDEVAYKVTTKDIVLDIPSQEVITRDNAVLLMNAVAYINLTTPEKRFMVLKTIHGQFKTLYKLHYVLLSVKWI